MIKKIKIILDDLEPFNFALLFTCFLGLLMTIFLYFLYLFLYIFGEPMVITKEPDLKYFFIE